MNTLLEETKLYQAPIDRMGEYPIPSEHPASKESLKLQRFVNWQFELN